MSGHYERRKRREQAEQDALDAALAAWIKEESSENAHALFMAGCAYLGMRPEDHRPVETEWHGSRP